jgi:hypothetical protein
MTDTPLNAVQAYLDAFNAGDCAAMSAAFAADGSTGDSAYVVAPATMTFDLNGTPVTQSGATFTVALRRFTDSWRIAAWAWSKGAQRQ